MRKIAMANIARPTSSALPFSLGHPQKARSRSSQSERLHFGGAQEIFGGVQKISWEETRKAEGAKVPGAGIWPEAVQTVTHVSDRSFVASLTLSCASPKLYPHRKSGDSRTRQLEEKTWMGPQGEILF
jgi:hypothetical protein